MQKPTPLYEVPADQLLFNHHGLEEGRELGEARVVSTLWGGARVRIVHRQNRPGGAWLLAVLAVLGAAVAVWLTLARQQADQTGDAAGSQPSSHAAIPAQTGPVQDAPAMAVPVASVPTAAAPAAAGADAARAPNTGAANAPAPDPAAARAPAPRTSSASGSENAGDITPSVRRRLQPDAAAPRPSQQESRADKLNTPRAMPDPPTAGSARQSLPEHAGQQGESPAPTQTPPAGKGAQTEAKTAEPGVQSHPDAGTAPLPADADAAPAAKPAPKAAQP